MLIVPYKKYLYKIKENSHISWTNDILQITYIRTQLNSKENHSWILSINKNMKRNTKDIYKKRRNTQNLQLTIIITNQTFTDNFCITLPVFFDTQNVK